MSEKYQTTDEAFAKWLGEVDKLAAAQAVWVDATKSYVSMTGEDCWREMYDDGLTPDEAWGEEMDAARDFA